MTIPVLVAPTFVAFAGCCLFALEATALAQTNPICEALPPGRCWYVAADAPPGGDGSFARPLSRPQDAVDRVLPGDFVYLRGGAEFTHANAVGGRIFSSAGRDRRNGAPGALITVKSYPGERAVIRGRADAEGMPLENLSINVGASWWRVEGLRIIHGGIGVPGTFTLNVSNVWIVGNHISDMRASVGNFGMITIAGDQMADPGHPTNIYIQDNVIHTLWGMQPNNLGPLPWYEDQDIEHHAGIMLQHASGLVEITGNLIYEVPSIFYSKYDGPGPTLIRDNHFHTAQTIAFQWRSSRATFEGNVFTRFTRNGAGFGLGNATGSPVNAGPSATNVFRNNTFDFTPWAMNPSGSVEAVRFNLRSDHTFVDNVVMARGYLGLGSNFAQNNIDRNCVVWDANLVAVTGHTFDQYRAAFGHDQNAVRVLETDPGRVFAPDHSLIGQAAVLCAGRGAQIRGAAAQPFGTGCPGTGNKIPRIAGEGLPRVGNPSFGVRFSLAPARATAVLMLGALSLPVSIGGGCTLYPGPAPVPLVAMANGIGTGTVPLAVPQDPALVGGVVFAQWGVLDPGGAFGGIASFTEGLRLVVGP